MTMTATLKDQALESLLTTYQKPAVLNPWARYKCGCLIGRVYNHPRLSDGKVIVTSRVLELNAKCGYARTLNTYYRLVNKSTVNDIMRLRRKLRNE